jgi:peptidoglycan/xylan/chitin deacetylase (PgdA/CDA1 family)
MKSLREYKNKKGQDVLITTSWDDFSDYEPRLVQLLLEYQLPAMFYIPAGRMEYLKAWVLARELTVYDHFDIGSHTVSHALLTRIARDKVMCELRDSKDILEDKLQIPIKHFCYPRGYYDEDIAQMVEDAGYLTARTVKVLSTDISQDPFALQTTIHAYNRKEYNGRVWVELGAEYLDRVIENGGYFHLWGHSAEIDKHGEWTELEWFFSYMNRKIYENLQP